MRVSDAHPGRFHSTAAIVQGWQKTTRCVQGLICVSRVRYSADMSLRRVVASALSVIGLSAPACSHGGHPPKPCSGGGSTESAAVPSSGTPAGDATPAEADRFVADVNDELLRLIAEADRASWIKSTYITGDTEAAEAKAQEHVMEFLARKIKEGRRFEQVAGLSADTQRALYKLRYSAGLPSPDDPKKRVELAELASRMEGVYGKGRHCSKKYEPWIKKQEAAAAKKKTTFKVERQDGAPCLDLGNLTDLLASERDWDLQLEAWQGWHATARDNRANYARYVELGNEGARDLGFTDMGEIWKGRYDMSAADFEKEMDRLWGEVKPLYDELHCYARKKLRASYGEAKIGKRALLPAHAMGNMWAQEWSNLYGQLEPFPGKGQADVTRDIERWAGTDPKTGKPNVKKMAEAAEGFFTSLGMKKLPPTFWERSLFLQPADRDVVCHASAWDLGMSGDIRIKMCIKPTQEDLVTLHHELGHDYYYMYYDHLAPLFRDGANDGFHEGIGDTLALSVTPEYLKKIGITQEAKKSAEADLNLLMHRALDGVAFLPFGRLIDQWRFEVFSGRVKPNEYVAKWWELRKRYQGIAPAVARTEDDFDPGAKYHIPANVPYTRYFIARILQYQFHRALCKAAGFQGPLHECSIHGNAAAGAKMMAMLSLGASKPWPEALAAISGETRMDASAILDYYAPLVTWLKQQNQGEQCGWD